MKSIAFVGLSANDKMRGVERVVFEQLMALSKNLNFRDKFELTLIRAPWQNYFDALVDTGFKIVCLDMPKGMIRRHIYMNYHLSDSLVNFDLVHFCNTLPIPALHPGVKVTGMIHDVAEFAMPAKYSAVQSMYRRYLAKRMVRAAHLVFTVSEFSSREIGKFLGCGDRVRVAVNGVDHIARIFDENAGACESNASGLGRYFLSYGVVERTKGLDISLNAFAHFKRLYPECGDVKYVVIGESGNLTSEISGLLSRSDVEYRRFVPDRELVRLISGAEAVLFLSEYEGFGFPALEALLVGRHVVVGRGTVLQEICSPWALVVNLKDELDIVGSMKRLASGNCDLPPIDPVALKNRFSWASCASVLDREWTGLLSNAF